MLHGIGWVDATSFLDQSLKRKKPTSFCITLDTHWKLLGFSRPRDIVYYLKNNKKNPLILIIFSLQIFFEGVQECIAAGVKEDEVGYQLAFSKQELRKNIKEYPAKDIKKGLELLYKKVEKHLCEEENLLQVKW